MMKKRHLFDADFKLEAARMVQDQGFSVPEVSRSMQVGETALRRWVAQYAAEQMGQPGIGKPLTPEQQQIRRLEEQVWQLKSDNDL